MANELSVKQVEEAPDVIKAFKDYTFENCSHADRDRNYDYCAGCASYFMRSLRAELAEKEKEIERLRGDRDLYVQLKIGQTERADQLHERGLELLTEIESLRANQATVVQDVWDKAIEIAGAERHGKALHQEWSQVHHDTVDRIIAALKAARHTEDDHSHSDSPYLSRETPN